MRRALKAFAVIALLAACGALGIAARHWGLGLMRISGTSMNDTLVSGDVVLVTRFDYRSGGTPELGDVVECRFPGRSDTYVKRVAGLPGEHVTLEAGGLSIDGFPVREPYVSSQAEDYEITLGEGEYLLLGDNRADSYDSRMPDMGPVGVEAFLGRVRFIVWPPGRIGRVN